MQTTITNTMAFGFPGEHANGQPFYADSYVASSEVSFGSPVYADGDESGFRKAKSTGTAVTKYVGIAVSPHQHIKFELPSDSHSITVPAGTTIGVAGKGSWFTNLVTGAQTGSSTDGQHIVWTKNSDLVIGAKVYADANGVLTLSSSNTVLVGEILDFEIQKDAEGTISGSDPYTVTITKQAKGVMLVRLG